MDAEAKKLLALEEELKKDLEAIARVRRMIASKENTPAPDDRQFTLPITSIASMSAAQRPNPLAEENEDLDDNVSIQSLKGTVENMLNADPNVRWTTQKVLSALQQNGFPLKAQRPIYSVGQALNKAVKQGKVRLVRKGSGNEPNIYKGKLPAVSEVIAQPQTQPQPPSQHVEAETLKRDTDEFSAPN